MPNSFQNIRLWTNFYWHNFLHKIINDLKRHFHVMEKLGEFFSCSYEQLLSLLLNVSKDIHLQLSLNYVTKILIPITVYLLNIIIDNINWSINFSFIPESSNTNISHQPLTTCYPLWINSTRTQIQKVICTQNWF